jgi:AraC-like DNA-binding protein
MSAGFAPFGRVLERAARELMHEKTLSPASAEALIRATSMEFDLLHSDLATQLTRIDATKPSTRRDILQRVYRARSYLHDHPGRTVTLAEIAAVAGMSQFHLARSFRAVFGIPPVQYHAGLRIALAEKELRRGHISIAEAAQRFGFAEPSSFSRAFVRVAGITPGQASRRIARSC